MNKDLFDYAILQSKLIEANEKILNLQKENEELENLIKHYKTSRQHWNTIARENFKFESTLKKIRNEIRALQEKYFKECVPGGCGDMSDLIEIIDKGIGEE